MSRLFTFLACMLCLIASGQSKLKTENVILITLDGMRWQEIFGGAEARLITKDFVSDTAALRRDFWADTPQKRRERLLPFFWSVIAQQGQLYGNRGYDNFVNVTNQQWFSYPGYSELLCGFADDARITSNDKFDNPNKTVLEFINSQPAFAGKVSAYSSWDVFPFIINTKRSGLQVNSGIVQASMPNEREKMLNELMNEVPNPLGDVRLDAFTFHYAFEYLKKKNPRMMFISFDETDDFAHGGHYDWYLRSARYTDQFIKTLWDWCQLDKNYAGKTTLIITCDHGRGSTTLTDWRDHGRKVPNTDQTWIAILGPDTPARGEVKVPGQLYQNQIAKTMAALLGLSYKNTVPVGDVIDSMITR